MCPVNWTAIGAVAGCIYTVAFIGSVVILVRQLRAQARQLQAQSFSEVYERLQAEEVREARGKLYELDEKKIGFEQWQNDDDSMQAVEKVCQRYDYFAKMVRYEFLPRNLILQSWAWQVDRLWRVAKPFVKGRRTIPGQGHLWEDFQWFAQQSATWLSNHKSSIGVLPID